MKISAIGTSINITDKSYNNIYSRQTTFGVGDYDYGPYEGPSNGGDGGDVIRYMQALAEFCFHLVWDNMTNHLDDDSTGWDDPDNTYSGGITSELPKTEPEE